MDILTKEDIIQYLRTNKKFLEEQFGVTKIALFGSYARNEAGLNSDIDLLIEVKLQDFKNRLHLKEHLENHFKRKVDVGYFNGIRIFVRRRIEKDLVYA